MREASNIILGGGGVIGSAISSYLESEGESIISVNSKNYHNCIGAKADVLINCNGNAFRYRANQNPRWDFESSVITVEHSLFDFCARLYVYISTVDVYNVLHDPMRNKEISSIQPEQLDTYGFHKWLAERLVEKYAMRSVILRVGTVLGDGMKKGPIYDLLNGKALHMSLGSELTFIDTNTIAKAIKAIIATNPMHEIYNLTGTGFIRLHDIQGKIPFPIRLSHGAEGVIYNYNINNDKINTIIKIPSTIDIVENFIEGHFNLQL
ncbi:MAG: NAD-dependent epimerase/dehydratase family protein [Planctomycetes bacterium]|uniref:NAD-dependent epimerase/dehydratase family protein n=1 Tax=Candidatus Wunengus sp. YC65 TaxID=3367701 RepID=UPI001D2750AE|nr:NAD-dependent epimerase/dehydratase family protein [Planctomycetota bacterium]